MSISKINSAIELTCHQSGRFLEIAIVISVATAMTGDIGESVVSSV